MRQSRRPALANLGKTAQHRSGRLVQSICTPELGEISLRPLPCLSQAFASALRRDRVDQVVIALDIDAAQLCGHSVALRSEFSKAVRVLDAFRETRECRGPERAYLRRS